MRIDPVTRLSGSIRVPGDKSISHRYAMLAAMASGTTRLSHFASSRDCQSTLNCLRGLGVEIERKGDEVQIQSQGWKAFRQPPESLDAENSGTTIRLISALLSCRPIQTAIQGDESLNRRPMQRIIRPLEQMGARVEARDGGFPPLRIHGTNLQPITYHLPVASAQVKSCVLLAGLTAEGETRVVEEISTRDHTERALPHFGAEFLRDGSNLIVHGGRPLTATALEVPGDFSSAVFFIAAALLIPGSQLTLETVGVNPTRTGLLSLLEGSGAAIRRTRPDCRNSEPVCDLTVDYREAFLESFPAEIGGHWIPNLIDEIPMLAVLATRLKSGLTVCDAAELRKKESDRIRAVTLNLRRLGVTVEERPDGFRVEPGQTIKGGTVQTFGDHRIAMAFAIAGLLAESPVELDQPDCVSVSFPEFFETLGSVST